MKPPTQFEHFVADYFREKGYDAEVTREVKDCGVDVILTKDKDRIAVQVKMYGNANRKVNRRSFMELYGVKFFFDCTKAFMVTNGFVWNDAKIVADKLGIEIIYLQFNPALASPISQLIQNQGTETDTDDFYEIWNKYIIPLKGKIVTGVNGLTNMIKDVDYANVTRITKNGEKNPIPIEPFKWAIHRILTYGSVTRKEIDQEYDGRLSSGTILILSQIPLFTALENPLRIVKSTT